MWKIGYYYRLKKQFRDNDGNKKLIEWRKCIKKFNNKYKLKGHHVWWLSVMVKDFEESKYNPRNEKIRRILNDE